MHVPHFHFATTLSPAAVGLPAVLGKSVLWLALDSSSFLSDTYQRWTRVLPGMPRYLFLVHYGDGAAYETDNHPYPLHTRKLELDFSS